MDSELMGFKSGTIELDEPKAVYYSGQMIVGKVNFKLYSPLSYLSLNITYKGEANVLWTEEETETYSGVKRKREVKYVGHEEYFNYTQCLSGGNGVSQLPIGTHSFPFQYQIPFTAPSSFKGEKGEVAYSVTAFVIHNNGSTKEEISKELTVIAPLDMNSEEIKRPIELEFEEVFSCMCACAARPLRLSVHSAHAGAAPAQRVPLRVRARNLAAVEVTNIRIQLARRMRFLSQQPMSAVVPPEEIIASLEKGPILSKTERDYDFELEVPSFIALNLDNCGIIDVGYFLKVTLEVSGCNDDMTDEAEFCIGLVPPGSAADARATHPLADSLPSAPVPTVPPTDNQPYNTSFVAPNMQICPPAPNYPYMGSNVPEGNGFGSRNNLPGAFEVNAKYQVNQSMPSMPALPMAAFPPLPQGANGPYNPPQYPSGPYNPPQYPSGPYNPQGSSDAYNTSAVPQTPPPPYSMQSYSPAPSAPPPMS